MALIVGGTEVTSTAAELNLLDGETGVNTGGSKRVWAKSDWATRQQTTNDWTGSGFHTDSQQLSYVIMCVPSDFSTLTSCTGYFITTGTGNMYHRVSAWCAGEDIAYNADIDSFSGTTAGLVANTVEAVNFTTAVDGMSIVGTDLLSFMVRCDRDHASDTVSAHITFFGIEMIYT